MCILEDQSEFIVKDQLPAELSSLQAVRPAAAVSELSPPGLFQNAAKGCSLAALLSSNSLVVPIMKLDSLQDARVRVRNIGL